MATVDQSYVDHCSTRHNMLSVLRKELRHMYIERETLKVKQRRLFLKNDHEENSRLPNDQRRGRLHRPTKQDRDVAGKRHPTRSVELPGIFTSGDHKVTSENVFSPHLDITIDKLPHSLPPLGLGAGRRGSRQSLVSSDGEDKQDPSITLFPGFSTRRHRGLRSVGELEQNELMTSIKGGLYYRSKDGILRKKRSRYGAKFKRLAKFLSVLFGLWKEHAKRVQHFMDTNVDLLEVDEVQNLLFDVTEYRSDKQSSISHDAIRILNTDPNLRSQEDIKYIQIAFGNYSSISEYPVRMKRLMAQRAWYEKYDAKRMILKQGHSPRCFYYILSGTVLVTQMDALGVSHTVCFLNRDESFGELGIINNAPRKASIISKDCVELLVFGDEDYTEIFMSGGLGNPKDPFLMSVDFMTGWPLEKLGDSNTSLLTYFRRGATLVHDINCSDWMFIIKSGSCQVLKKLAKATPTKKGCKSNQTRTVMPNCADYGNEDLHKADIAKEMKKAEAKSRRKTKSCKIRQLQELQLGVPLVSMDEILGTQEDPIIKVELANNTDEMINTDESTWEDDVSDKTYIDGQNGIDEDRINEEEYMDWDNLDSTRRTRAGKLTSTKPFLTRSEKNSPPRDEPKKSDSLKARLERIRKKREQKASRHTLEDELNQEFLHNLRFHPPAPDDTEPVYVCVQTLISGDVFGLSHVLFEEQPSLSLVSNGAECVVIRKQFFLDNLSSKQLIRLRKEESPYPTEEELQQALQTQVDWDAHRESLIEYTRICVQMEKANIYDSRALVEH